MIELFKQDGKVIRYWKGEVTGNAVTYTWGQVNGKMQVKTDAYTIGKNVGKKNETTPHQQAVLEMESKARKKKDKGYCLKGQTPSSRPLPMLAYSIAKHMKKLIGTVFLQKKFDGIRCLANRLTGKLYTRRGKLIVSLPHIEDAIKQLNVADDIVWIDGELFNSELSFQEITRIVKREEVHDNHKDISFHVYDYISDDVYSKRNATLFFSNIDDIKYIENVETWQIDNVTPETFIKDTYALYEQILGEGYEGIMIRLDKPYKVGKRSDGLLKMKPMMDDEFEIIGFKKEKFKERLGAFVMKTKGGLIFEGRPAMTHKELQKIYIDADNYIGMLATVQFQELTDGGVPRFPVVKGIRWEADI